MDRRDDIRVYERAISAALCNERKVMGPSDTDDSLMLSALDGIGSYGSFDIPKVNDTDETIWNVVCEPKISFNKEVV
jgi:hypothetical protein